MQASIRSFWTGMAVGEMVDMRASWPVRAEVREGSEV